MPSQIVRQVKLTDIILPAGLHREVEDPEGISELGRSLKHYGLINPITLAKDPDGHLTLIAGRRRLAAAEWAGWDKIGATIVTRSEVEQEIMRWHENLYRLNLNAIEEGKAIVTNLQKWQITEQEMAEMIGRSVSWVSQRVALVSGPEDVALAVETGEISFGVGRELSQVEDTDTRHRLLNYAKEGGATARVAKTWKEAAEAEATEAPPENPLEYTSLEMGPEVIVKIKCPVCKGEKPLEEMKTLRLCEHCLLNFQIGLNSTED